MNIEFSGKSFLDLLILSTGLPEDLIAPYLKNLAEQYNCPIEKLNLDILKDILRDEVLKLILLNEENEIIKSFH